MLLTAGADRVTLVIHIVTPMPPPNGAQEFCVFSKSARCLRGPISWLFSVFLFFYVACEVGVWNWLAQHLIAQGIAESRALEYTVFSASRWAC